MPESRILIFVTHPVQYHVPVWRALAARDDLAVKVFYFSDHSVRGGLDKGFGIQVSWDVDLLSGYNHEFLSRTRDFERPRSVRIEDMDALLERERPDWILIGGYTMAFERQLVRAASKHGARVAMRAEFSDLSYGKRSLLKRAARRAYLSWFYRRVDAFCYPGQGGRRHLARHGVPPDRMFFAPYCVDDQLISRGRASVSREAAREALAIAPDTFVIVLSGKLIPRKNADELLTALSQLDAIRARIGLIVLGDGELRDAFGARARSLLGDRLIFPGFVNQSQLTRFFLAADVLVMPSLQETWGLVVNEAMLHALPVIVSDQVGCHEDLVIQGETGYVYPVGNAAALANAISAMVDAPERTAQMGRNAERHIAKYSIEAAANGVAKALQS